MGREPGSSLQQERGCERPTFYQPETAAFAEGGGAAVTALPHSQCRLAAVCTFALQNEL